MKVYLSIFLCFTVGALFGQDFAMVQGVITDENKEVIPLVGVFQEGFTNRSATSNEKGFYRLQVSVSDKPIVLKVSHTGFLPYTKSIKLKAGDTLTLNIELKFRTLIEFEVESEKARSGTLTKLDASVINKITSVNQGIEQLLVAQALGVNMNNELSSNYSVRGGSFDENLVYVNDIEVYRPFLARAGEQEGLSFANPDMVEGIVFSSGGFEARYGDKLSSVLDIQYKKPKSFGGSAQASLLGGSAHIEGASKDKKFTHISGIRYRDNQYVLGTLDVDGDYAPVFTDFQTYLTYSINSRLEVSFLGNYARNSFTFTPQTRETRLGNLNEALQLRVFFEGQEISGYETSFAASTLSYKLTEDVDVKFIASAFEATEVETFDVLGQYFLDELDRDLGSENFGNVIQNRGVGSFLNHARNQLNSRVFAFETKTYYTPNSKTTVLAGLKYQYEDVADRLDEWQYLDSAGFAVPHALGNIGYTDPADRTFREIPLGNRVRNQNRIFSNRISGYTQATRLHTSKDTAYWAFNAGMRFQYWDFNNELVVSPRANVSYRPNVKYFSKTDSIYKRRDIRLRFATGMYYQPAFYREMRDFNGDVNEDIRAQQSIHFVAGVDYIFEFWTRPFKLTTEAYYKHLNNIIPYEIDNVRLRYFATNNAVGYAYGLDAKLNGEFIKGIPSWIGFSYLRTEEDILDDFFLVRRNAAGEVITPRVSDQTVATVERVEPGFIPRPTDQRLNFNMFFQDRMKNAPQYSVQLNIIFGTGLPFGPPNQQRWQQTLRTPAYRRVDIGFSRELVGANVKPPKEGSMFAKLKEAFVTVEVFNLFQVNNTNNYTWIRDVSGRLYAVPNFLTGRRLNVRLVTRF
ncbi:MAG: TonB-dependent receptor [Luteibaculaceae bacterium]